MSTQFLFDDTHRPAYLDISSDRKTITKVTSGGHVGAFGNVQFTDGVHSWKFRLNSLSASHWVAFGVVQTKDDGYAVGWGISSKNQRYTGPDGGTSGICGASGDWTDGDIVRVDLNCVFHCVTITNERTGRFETVSGLPAVPLMPWVNLYNPGNSVSLI
jgi:hypothetical protein